MGYDVRENTGNADDPTADDIIEHVLERAADPRGSVHVDEFAADAVDIFSESAVERCVRLILLGGYSKREAGAEAFGSSDYQWGINVGSAVSMYLHNWDSDD